MRALAAAARVNTKWTKPTEPKRILSLTKPALRLTTMAAAASKVWVNPRFGLYTILLLPLLNVEWQHQGGWGETVYCAILRATCNGGGAIQKVVDAKDSMD